MSNIQSLARKDYKLLMTKRKERRSAVYLARPHVTRRDLAEVYQAMAADESREREAAEWVDNLAGDIAREPG
jgi:hypothetical protein